MKIKNKFVNGAIIFLACVAIPFGISNQEGILFIPGILILGYYALEAVKYLIRKKKEDKKENKKQIEIKTEETEDGEIRE
jgi:phosphotransferase system  glucose/maltose/N-acetylglucosamine-specific IIC component